MTTNNKARTTGASASIKANLLWSYLVTRARLGGVNLTSLERVRDYIRRKFDPDLAVRDRSSRPDHFPGLSGRPVHDTAKFTWVRTIEDAADEITGEYEQLRERGRLSPHPQSLTDTGEWNTYYLYSNGVRFAAHCDACPASAGVLASLTDDVLAGQAYFSIMAPGTHVQPHHGPTNTRIRCHLGLRIPPSSRLRIDSEMLRWTEGRCLVFDDSFEHEVWNPDEERAVFIVDVWHPELSDKERWALKTLAQVSRRNRRYRNAAIRKAQASVA